MSKDKALTQEDVLNAYIKGFINGADTIRKEQDIEKENITASINEALEFLNLSGHDSRDTFIASVLDMALESAVDKYGEDAPIPSVDSGFIKEEIERIADDMMETDAAREALEEEEGERTSTAITEEAINADAETAEDEELNRIQEV